MINLQKEIIFRDGITELEDCSDEELYETKCRATYLCQLGEYYGLSLDKFEIYDDLIYFEWHGTKFNVLRFYTYYSKHMTDETLEHRKAVQKIILNK